MAGVDTPNATSAEDVATCLNADIAQLVKTLVYRAAGGPEDGNIVAACIRGDDQLQEIKLVRALNATSVEMASDEEIKAVGGVTGFVGPVGLSCKRLFDDTLKNAVGLIAGANRRDIHITGLDISRDESAAEFADLRQTRAGDGCPKCGGSVELSRGIEVGHVFALGTCYSEPMEVQFQNREGKRSTATMGCYGIGVSRLMAAVVEQCNDENGISWPLNLAPFQVAIITMGKSDRGLEASEKIYHELLDAGIEVLWDDRKERPGVKFKDAELMGLPIHLIVGDRGLESGVVEIRRRNEDKEEVQLDQILPALQSLLGGSQT
jgi:prolyl-tRNA synthetase